MSQLYLIRRESEKLVGPYTISELRDAFDRMEFGIADEISGHLGPWVTIDKRQELKQFYPNLYKVFNPGDRTRANKRVPGMLEDSLLNEVQISVKRKKQPTWFYFSLVLIVGIGVATTFVLFKRQKATELKPAQYYKEIFQISGAENCMRALEPKIGVAISQFNQNKATRSEWLPLLRLYAFHHSGYLRGVSPDLLKGNVWKPLPKDCSSASWIRRFKQIQDSNLQFQADQIHKIRGIEILAMDPYWAKRRKDSSFLSPSNYYQACAMTARKAVTKLQNSMPNLGSNSASSNRFLQLAARVDWINLAIAGRAPTRMDMPVNDLIRKWTCLEQESSLEGLNNCVLGGNNGEKSLERIHPDILHRYRLNVLRIALNGDADAVLSIGESAIFDFSKYSLPDFLFSFDVKPEKSILEEIRQYTQRNPGARVDLEAVKKQAAKTYPDIAF